MPVDENAGPRYQYRVKFGDDIIVVKGTTHAPCHTPGSGRSLKVCDGEREVLTVGGDAYKGFTRKPLYEYIPVEKRTLYSTGMKLNLCLTAKIIGAEMLSSEPRRFQVDIFGIDGEHIYTGLHMESEIDAVVTTEK